MTRPTTRKRLFPSGRKTIASPSSSDWPVASSTTTLCVTSTLSFPGAGRVPISLRASRICFRHAASCSAAIVLSSAGCTVARPNASLAVSSVRQYALESTFPTGNWSRRTPRPIARASARPCAERFRCVEQSETTTGSWSGFEKSVAAWRNTSTSPPAEAPREIRARRGRRAGDERQGERGDENGSERARGRHRLPPSQTGDPRYPRERRRAIEPCDADYAVVRRPIEVTPPARPATRTADTAPPSPQTPLSPSRDPRRAPAPRSPPAGTRSARDRGCTTRSRSAHPR